MSTEANQPPEQVDESKTIATTGLGEVNSDSTTLFCISRGFTLYIPLRNIDTGVLRAGKFAPRPNAVRFYLITSLNLPKFVCVRC